MDVPAPVPVTTPEVPIVATNTDVELHIPPVNELLKVIVVPWQNGVLPIITPGNGSTVTVAFIVPHVER